MKKVALTLALAAAAVPASSEAKPHMCPAPSSPVASRCVHRPHMCAAPSSPARQSSPCARMVAVRVEL